MHIRWDYRRLALDMQITITHFRLQETPQPKNLLPVIFMISLSPMRDMTGLLEGREWAYREIRIDHPVFLPDAVRTTCMVQANLKDPK